MALSADLTLRAAVHAAWEVIALNARRAGIKRAINLGSGLVEETCYGGLGVPSPSRTAVASAARPVCRPAIVLALLGALWLPPVASAQRYEPPKYDPKSCKVDVDGRVFVALRNQLMAIPVEQLGLIEPHHPRDPFKPTIAGDPTEPEGCPGNPFQTSRYVPHLHLVPPPSGPGAIPDPGWAVDGLTLIYTDPEPVKGRPGVVWVGEETNLRLLDLICTRADIKESLHNGLQACRVKQVDSKVRVEDWGATYTVAPEVYATPLGNRFVIDCDPDLFSGRIGRCTVDYSLSQNAGISYSFHPFGPGRHLALDHVLTFDRQLRAAIEGYVADARKWRGP